MPWRWRQYWRNPWRRRRRWRTFRWRPRKVIRRRRRYRVRKSKRKLKRLTLHQWQPSSIRLCKIKGLMCLFQCNPFRLGNNIALYNQSIVPPHLPGGGGFSVYQYTLHNLYTMHQYVRNWWTSSNVNLPLVRYVKCIFKIYQSKNVDIVFRYFRHFPMESTNLTYPSVQPSVMMMLKNSVLIPSKETKRLRKGYKKIIIRPPEIMTNKWYFQQKIANIPLLITHCTAASFDNYYIDSNNLSTNVTIQCLNSQLIQNRNFGTNAPYPIRVLGTQDIWLIASDDVLITETDQPTYMSLTLLADAKNYTEGHSYNSAQTQATPLRPKDWKTYCENIAQYMGNPFHENYLNYDKTHHITLFQYQGTIQTLFDKTKHVTTSTKVDSTIPLTKIIAPLLIPCRYNPNTDNGSTNITYILPNNKGQHGWDPPQDKRFELSGFPLYINLFGYLDFQKKQHLMHNIDTTAIVVIQSTAIHPIYDTQLKYFIPLSYDFTLGHSPFESDLNPIDEKRWYLMAQYQEPALNVIISCGPGTAKIPPKQSVEAKCEYTFIFKFGGNPAPMVQLTDPDNQPQYPIPNNVISTNSLQDPTTPAELFLYNFDERRQIITKAATERITKDWGLTKTLFSDATTTPAAPAVLQTHQTSEDETSDEEKQEKTLFQQLLRHREKQHKLKYRIKQILNKMAST
nr:MAG: ORF1 [TTV-like mini virus]